MQPISTYRGKVNNANQGLFEFLQMETDNHSSIVNATFYSFNIGKQLCELVFTRFQIQNVY